LEKRRRSPPSQGNALSRKRGGEGFYCPTGTLGRKEKGEQESREGIKKGLPTGTYHNDGELVKKGFLAYSCRGGGGGGGGEGKTMRSSSNESLEKNNNDSSKIEKTSAFCSEKGEEIL